MLFQTSFFFQSRRACYIISSPLCKYLTTPSNRFSNLGIEIGERIKYYSDFLKHSDLSHGKATHAQLVKSSHDSSIFLQNFLLQMYTKCGDFNSALNLFDEMPQRNCVSWSSLIAGFVQRGYPNQALYLFSCMYRVAVRPREFTFVSTLNACSFTGHVHHAHQVYALVVQLGFEWNVFVINAFLTALIRNNQFVDAMKAFDECLIRDIVSWNTMLTGYLEFSVLEVPHFWLSMIREGMKPDGFSFSTVISSLADIGDDRLGVQVHGQLVKYGHGCETCVGNSVVDMYLKFRDLVNGYRAFHEITSKNVLSWTTMATGCVTCGMPSKALELLVEMKVAGIMPNRYTLATTFKACANMAAFDEGKKAHSLRIKLGSEIDVCADNALLDMYVKCGQMDDSMTVFRRIKNHTIVTWTTMVMGFAQNGRAAEAISIFDEMVTKGIEPNHITFLCVLYACSQQGLIEEGWKYFTSMTQKHGISQEEDHYACMVDLLGRTGHIKEAEELISKMPFQPGPLIFQTLLGACHIHGDIEVGRRAAVRVMHLNQSCPSTYVLLSNMFAGLHHWQGADMFRNMMQSRNVNKIPGTSTL